MKGMKSAKDYYEPPPKGTYPGTVTLAEATFSKKNGTSMIHIQTSLDGMSEVLDDYIITDGTAKGAGIGKAKLRGLGIDVNTDAEVPDEVVCQQLLGRKTVVVLDHEPAQRKNEAGELVPSTHFDPDTGKTIQLYRAIAKGYQQANVGAVAQAPTQGYAPPQQAAQNFAPQGYPQQAPQQFAQPGFAPQASQGYPQQAQFAPPQGFAPQAQQQFAPQQAYPQVPPGFAPAPAPWAGQPPQAPPAQPNGAAEAATGKGKRKMKVEDAAEG